MNRNASSCITAGAVLLTTGLAVACSSSSSSVAGPVTGRETFTGTEVLTSAQAASNSFEPTIPLTASGLFSDTGSIHLGGGSAAGATSIVLKNGDVNVHHAATNPNLQPVPMGAASACVYGATEPVKYTVTGGTGSYKNITGGSGVATVTFEFDLPKMANGKCDVANSATPTGGKVTFTAVGPITRSS